MKKTIALVILMSGVSWGAITPAQIQQARQATSQMQDTLGKLQIFIQQVRPLIEGGNIYRLEFSQSPVNLTAQQQQDIIDYYNSLKATLATQFGQLP